MSSPNRPFASRFASTATAIVSACALTTTPGGAQVRSPRPVTEQVTELVAIYSNGKDRDLTTADAAPQTAYDSVRAFIHDPLCRRVRASAVLCSAAFEPAVKDGRSATPSADLIHRVYSETVQLDAYASVNVQAAGSGPMALDLVASQAAIVNGLTDFVVNRAKDEVVVSFVLGLREHVRSDAALARLFPQTILATADVHARSARQVLPSLRAAFRADLESLPVSALDPGTLAVVKALAIARLPERARDVKAAFDRFLTNSPPVLAIAKRFKGLIDGEQPLDVIARLASIDGAEVSDVPTRSALVTTGIIAREYRLSGGAVKKPLADPRQRELFLALVLRDVLESSATADQSATLSWGAMVADRLQTDLVGVMTSVDELARALTEARAAARTQSGAANASALATLTNAVVQVVSAARPLVAYDGPARAYWDTTAAMLTHVRKLESALTERRYVTAASELDLLFAGRLANSLAPSQVRVITLAAAVAEAQTADEVSAAFEAAADPVVSFRAKRSASRDDRAALFGLNAYVGFGGGSEHAFAQGATGGMAQYAGLTLPIGPEWSIPTGGDIASLSIFVPILDLGTVASFRFNGNDKVQATPSVTFAQVIAPGAYAVFGLSKTVPASLAVGAQYVPGLRKATADNRPMNTVRVGVFAAVDVPLFHF